MDPLPEFLILLLLIAGMGMGLFGLIVPVFPGLTVIWALILVYGLIFGFGMLGGWVFALITILMVVGWFSDNLLMGGNAIQEGASWLSIFAAAVAGFVGSFFLTPLGGILAALLGLFLAEYIAPQGSDCGAASIQGYAIAGGPLRGALHWPVHGLAVGVWPGLASAFLPEIFWLCSSFMQARCSWLWRQGQRSPA
jgi:uncharacterized protein YqgC (DUF456 family)